MLNNIYVYKLKLDEDWTKGAFGQTISGSNQHFYEVLLNNKWSQYILDSINIGQIPQFVIPWTRTNGTSGYVVINQYNIGQNTNNNINMQIWFYVPSYAGVKPLIDGTTEIRMIIRP